MTDDTRKPVDELSGRELDAAVAEEVMGWRWRTWDRDAYKESGLTYPDHASEKVCVMVSPDVPDSHLMPTAGNDDGLRRRFGPNPPRYCSDISAAWELIDEIVAPGFELSRLPDNSGFKAAFHDTENYIYAHADTAPEAICRAALRAVEVDDE